MEKSRKCPVCGTELESIIALVGVLNDEDTYLYWCPKDGIRVKVKGVEIVEIKYPALVPKLPQSHWSEHPNFPVDDWKAEIQAGETRLGYWQWVINRKEKS